MGAALALYDVVDEQYQKMVQYLSTEDAYWLFSDIWKIEDTAFQQAGIKAGPRKTGELADFSGYPEGRLKIESKYFLLYSIRNGILSASNVYSHYRNAIRDIGVQLHKSPNLNDLSDLEVDPTRCTEAEQDRLYGVYVRDTVAFFTDLYDDRPEFEKDIWHALKIPGTRISAALKSQNPAISFQEFPDAYRPMVKRYMSRLVVKRSWSFSRENLMYIRYFFHSYYSHGYNDGFLATLSRCDVEKYLTWVAEDYKDKNATFRSKAISFVRQFIDYIQLAEYPEAPEKDVNRLFFDDDVPRRERTADTMAKVKYIPEPVRENLDACIGEIKPEKWMPVYVLLRESGWRGTDILNLRYDNCLDYVWNAKEKTYVPYLCGEITKTGIPKLRVPIRDEVEKLVKKLAGEAKQLSTDENNPDRYLFNTYEGRHKGLPYSKPAFTKAVQSLIDEKNILDGDGNLYHFKAHSLRHTRAMEYTEQGMPIGIIQQLLGHCSIQMTLHYARVSEDMLFQKWKATENLGLLRLDTTPPLQETSKPDGIHFEHIRNGLEALKMPLGMCFAPAKLQCRQQQNPCLTCSSFCAGNDDIPAYEAEIRRVEEHLRLCGELNRPEWAEKNQEYLDALKSMLARIKANGVAHKNASTREATNG